LKKAIFKSVLKTHWSAGTNVHLNRNKTNYKSSLGMAMGIGAQGAEALILCIVYVKFQT
jgi:hypothetical protein